MVEGIGGENNSNGFCLKSSEVVCSESSEDNRSMFSSDGRDESMRNMGIGPPLVRSRRSRVVMGARSVGRERRSSLLMDEKRSELRKKMSMGTGYGISNSSTTVQCDYLTALVTHFLQT